MLGFNAWNAVGSHVNASFLMSTADAFVSTGLAKAGYLYVNSDDGWDLPTRDSVTGDLVADPTKFPGGFAAVAAYIHSVGLKAGIYTAKGPTTCAGLAASCGHEVQDAALWASWGIDYVKDDACTYCGTQTDEESYGAMSRALRATGRDFVLTVEGAPDNANCSASGACGNAKRVGHDVRPLWSSVVSLVDIGSGLARFAHNATSAARPAWWNDLDILEVGNGPDFLCGADAAALARCRAHFTLWAVMKSPLLLGSVLTALDAATLGVLGNAEVLAVSQDALGVQARRVAVAAPRNASLSLDARLNVAAAVACDARVPTQAWAFAAAPPAPAALFLAPRDESDPAQVWRFAPTTGPPLGATLLTSALTGACVDSQAAHDPARAAACDAARATAGQLWALLPSGKVATRATGVCLEVNGARGGAPGPDVAIATCHGAGLAQAWTATPARGGAGVLLCSALDGARCLRLTDAAPPALLSTVDAVGMAAGRAWCLSSGVAEGDWTGAPCDARQPAQLFTWFDPAGVARGPANATVSSGRGALAANLQVGASGPVPHSRWATGAWDGRGAWTVDAAALRAGGPRTRVLFADAAAVIDDDFLGNVTAGADFCLDLVPGGWLETWAAPLTGGRFAVVLLNRSPAPEVVAVAWAALDAPAGARFAVRDVWAAVDAGVFVDGYNATVSSLAVALLVLTPVQLY